MPLLDLLVEFTLASVVFALVIGFVLAPFFGGALYLRHRVNAAHHDQHWRERRLSHERR